MPADPTEDHVPAASGVSDRTTASGPSAVADPLPDIPGYAVVGEIARGGMGRVLAARELALDREVAVKVLLPKARADRFATEARITARLPHPNIPPVYALGELADGSPFLAMKLVRGRTLAADLKARPAADRLRLVPAFEGVCQAVAYAHARGVIHRDLKPANVMVGEFGEVQVMDWGLAKDLTVSREAESSEPSADPADHTQAGAVLGTPAYMPPEQARGEPADARSDVFALGGVLCAILTGRPPYTGESVAEVVRRAAAGRLSDAHARLDGCGVDAELVALARRCLHPDPGERPADAGVVAAAVAAYQSGVRERLRQSELAYAEAGARAQAEARRRRLARVLAGTVLLAVGLAGGGWAWVVNDRAARRGRVTSAISLARGRAEQLRDQALAVRPDGAKSAESAVTLWSAAAAALEPAEAALAAGGADPAVADPVAGLRAAIAAGGDDARLHAERFRSEERVRGALADARLLAGDALDGRPEATARAVAAFTAAFRDYGLDIPTGDVAAMADRLGGSPAAVQPDLFLSLIQWMTLLPDIQRGRFVGLLARADPDPFRKRLAFDLMIGGEDRLFEIQQEGATTPLPASAVGLLGNGLRNRGNVGLAAEVLRNGLRHHPTDFWLNVGLGDALLDRRGEVTPAHGVEAAGCYRVALAARPETWRLPERLGRALLVARDADGAIASFRRAYALAPRAAAAAVAGATADHLPPAERAKWDRFARELAAGEPGRRP